jgi:L-histidine N-alpha-methyltransferase
MELQLKGIKEGVGEFANDVLKGLSSSPKKLSSKYLYDHKGSKLFEEIMLLKEYYPTRCELEIFEKHKKSILQHCHTSEEVLDVVDLGAGNGLKALVLLKYFQRRVNLRYVPVDISESAIDQVEDCVKTKLPELKVEGVKAEYLQGLQQLKKNKHGQKLVLFLGSNIGNFSYKEALTFLTDLCASLNKDDLVLIGFDLKKDPSIVRAAYNDSKGVTAEFNLNILKRINTELDARFDITKFSFYPTYDPVTGETKSYLISNEDQDVFISKINKSFTFKKWEPIHTECSNKFDLPTIEKLAKLSGFTVEENFLDSKEYFVDSLWRVK